MPLAAVVDELDDLFQNCLSLSEEDHKFNQRCFPYPSCLQFVSTEILNSGCWNLEASFGLEGSRIMHQQSHRHIHTNIFRSGLLFFTQTELKGPSSVVDLFTSTGGGLNHNYPAADPCSLYTFAFTTDQLFLSSFLPWGFSLSYIRASGQAIWDSANLGSCSRPAEATGPLKSTSQTHLQSRTQVNRSSGMTCGQGLTVVKQLRLTQLHFTFNQGGIKQIYREIAIAKIQIINPE